LNLPIKFAQRYLFAKRSTNAINIISGITIFGLAIGTAALVLVLSVFNGLEGLIKSLTNNFNPDVKVIPAKGKVFKPDEDKIFQIQSLDGVEYISKTIEEIALFEYQDNQHFGILKGVDLNFHRVTAIDSTLREGNYILNKEEKVNFAILGWGMRNKLGVNIDNSFDVLKVYMAKRKNVGPFSDPFRKKSTVPRGVFRIQPEYDQKYVLSSLEFAQKLLNYREEISFLEIKLNPNNDGEETVNQIRNILGEDFIVKDRYQQDEAFNKIMNAEKWISFAIISLTLVLVSFNMIGALWMVVMDKKKDISILKAMGASDQLVRNIFINKGILLSFVGMGAGFALALFLYFLQKQFGLVPSPGFIVEAYPVEMVYTDFIWVAITVFIICLIASIGPAIKASQIPAIVREE
jgi:lipoprotein-releasing system permease protein